VSGSAAVVGDSLMLHSPCLLCAGVRQEAASVLRGLSRSVRLLRGPSLPPTLAGPLVALLLDSTASGVQVSQWRVGGAATNPTLQPQPPRARPTN
jgi:hypothetical protein